MRIFASTNAIAKRELGAHFIFHGERIFGLTSAMGQKTDVSARRLAILIISMWQVAISSCPEESAKFIIIDLENRLRRVHINRMNKTLIALSMMTLLAGCSGYSSAKQREICRQAYPDDGPKVEECVAVGDRQAAAEAWPWFKPGR